MTDTPTTNFFLTSEDIDAIGRVGSIGARHAARALSRLTATSVRLSKPEMKTLSIGEVPDLLGGMDAPAMGVLIPFHGDVVGNTLLLYSDDGAKELLKLLFPGDDEVTEELKDSAIAETGNILAGAIHTVMSRLTERILISLPPITVQDMAGAILDPLLAEAGSYTDEVVTLVFHLSDEDGTCLVKTVLIPGIECLQLMQEAANRLESG